jgi:Cu/Ag efflux pump CusA
MHHLRYHIAGALGAVLCVAVGFAALREADELWDTCLFSLTLGLLLFAVLLTAHRTGDRRAFWIGFALFGWGYLSFSLIPSTEPRLITTKALAYLHQASILGSRAYGMRAVLSPDRMRACNLSDDDVMKALRESRLNNNGSPPDIGFATDQTSMTVVEHVLTWRARYNKPAQYANIILKANPDGEILRLKDVAKVEVGTSFHIPGVWAGTAEAFIGIGHSLVALLAALLGGVLSRRLGRVSVAPEVQPEKRVQAGPVTE